MRDRILAAVLTLAVFAAGFGAGLWSERHRPIPPPPGAFMGEFGARQGKTPKPPAVNRSELSEQIAKLGPEMDNFRSRIADIYSQFDHDIEGILTPAQKAKYEERFKSHRNLPPPELGTGDGPLSDEQIEVLLQRPFRTLAFIVVLPMTLERMTNELKLDDTQREKVRDLLRVRREKFVELVDSA
ncbi:MAG TPA: hypothetical protein VGG37_01065, partial [Opitutaceae bacterium]